jgi:RecA-family ATPase
MGCFIVGSEYASLEATATWLIRDIVPVGGMVNLYGKPKVGKSFFALGMAEAISCGHTHFLGLPVLHHGPVAYLQIDTPRSIWLDRIKRSSSGGHDFSNIYFADTLSGTPLPFNILENFNWLLDELALIKPVCLIIDTIRELHPGDENDSGVMKNVISALIRATNPLECATLFCSHKKKEQQNHMDDLMTDARGSSYIAGRMDAIMALGEKTLTYQSRACGQTRISLVQDSESGMWGLDREEQRFLDVLSLCYEEAPKASQRELARLVKQRLGEWKGESVTEEAVRMLVRRKIELVRPKLVKA